MCDCSIGMTAVLEYIKSVLKCVIIAFSSEGIFVVYEALDRSFVKLLVSMDVQFLRSSAKT